VSTTITTETQETDAAEQVAPAGTPPPPVTREAEYPQSPERVWKALTDPDALEKWLLPTTDFAPEPGRRFRLDAPEGTTVEGEVREAEPGRRLVYTWKTGADTPAGRVTWTLTPTERGGTRLRIVHEPGVAGLTMLRSRSHASFARRPSPALLLRTRLRATPGRLTAVLISGGKTHLL